MQCNDRLIYKTASDTHTAVTAVQEQLSKAHVLWCTLNKKKQQQKTKTKKAVRQAMPAVSFNGEVTEDMNSLRYLRIHFDRMLMYKTQIESTKLRCKKGLSALKTMAAKGIQQRHLFLLYHY